MNVVLFGSDARSTSSINSIIPVLVELNIKYVAIISRTTQNADPIRHREHYNFYSNLKEWGEGPFSTTLGVKLPFRPDWLLLQRERWYPESNIILEFKTSFGSKVGIVEGNAHILNNSETKLEMYSRNRFLPYIDVFFDHSDHIVEQRKIAGFLGNSVVVGNPKYDLNLDVDNPTLEWLKKLYDVDTNKEQVLLFGLVNSNRDKLFDQFEKIIKENPHRQYFYKPYPGEPFEDKFRSDFRPVFRLKNCTPILEEDHIWGVLDFCQTHIGCISSIFYPSILKNKTVIDLSTELELESVYLLKDHILKGDGPGLENNIEMWLRSFNFKSIKQLEELLPDSYFEEIKKSNKKVFEIVPNRENLLKLFDNYNDQKASYRIVKYLQENDVQK
jgi:hypothetical protein